MSSVNQIRKTFLEYFQKNGHEIVKSSPLVPRNDPTLMFTNAGMVQFKNIFTGMEKTDFSRATTSQKCVRAGGKHNDLDNVGYTARHHTFFEMLGNFSFGDYFKEQAIFYGWDLVTKEFGIDKNRLLTTVYAEDEEAFKLWKKISGLPDDRIIKIPTHDNFWAMGDTGPCGPCSEIFYDHGDHIKGGIPGSPDQDGDRFVEIWNLVFMQYEQVSENERRALPRPSIDTGMGLERIAAVLEGTHDNYEIGLMRGLIEESARLSKTEPYGEYRISHRVIADHLRACCFLIADGVSPSNEGRGYVLRRIMRRAMRHAHLVGCVEPLMWQLVPALISCMGEAYPELERAKPLIVETLKLEETRFKQMLSRGIRLLDTETENLKAGDILSGDVAFKLYDTYGFPLDLTEDALRSKKIKVDTDAFNEAMENQRNEARKSWAGSGETADNAVWFDLASKISATEFLGYDTETAEAKIEALIKDNKLTDVVKKGDEVMVVANQTPFYAESGGQVGDTGIIEIKNKAKLEVLDTLKVAGKIYAHKAKVVEGEIKNGDFAVFMVDSERRGAIRANHSVTHLLHKALRQVLGEHVTQKGSLVSDKRMRFDISHNHQVTKDELKEVEKIVNRAIRVNGLVSTKIMSPEDAVKEGAMALFGEKYGEEVRVVTMNGKGGKVFSVELCGGTHVAQTGDIGFFKIVGETAVGAGLRRIEAVTGDEALAYINEREEIIAKSAEVLKASPSELTKRISSLIDERKRLEKELSDTRKKLAEGGTSGSDEVLNIAGIKFIKKNLEGIPPKDLKPMADELKKKIGSGIVAVVSVNDDKLSLVVGVTSDLAGKAFDAVDLVQAGSAASGGKGGGGRPDMAQAGSPDGDKAVDALNAIEAKIKASA
ncbi:MAG: alanine--tRNA ligase [Alphaproteobacteria bacterium]